jgi:hypothetical protein
MLSVALEYEEIHGLEMQMQHRKFNRSNELLRGTLSM